MLIYHEIKWKGRVDPSVFCSVHLYKFEDKDNLGYQRRYYVLDQYAKWSGDTPPRVLIKAESHSDAAAIRVAVAAFDEMEREYDEQTK